MQFRVRRRSNFVVTVFLAMLPATVLAGGPKYIAGASYFNPSVLGEPVHWANGQLNYYVDQGVLSSTVTNHQATVMVDAAAALWNAVPTAGVTLTDMGQLNENVRGSDIAVNASGQIAAPADVTPSATNYPLGVIYDADGSVTNAIFGATASQPESCQNNGVFVWIDNINPDATIAHAIILLNGLCATTQPMIEMMSFEIERAFGRLLGLDYSQVNLGAIANSEPGSMLGWPVMQPLSGLCGASGGACIPNQNVLRYDDIAALNRIYPITAANLAGFPGKVITAANTVSITGTIEFANGYGMQGVNVVARPLDANGNPQYKYTVSFVSGAYFGGNHGNPVLGWNDASGNPLSMWGSNEPAMQGYFDLSGIPLPAGATSASYEITIEAIDPLYILTDSVGPYMQGQVAPSGTLNSVVLAGMTAGSTQTLTVAAAGTPEPGFNDAIGAVAQPRPMPATGFWCGRLSQVGQTDWFTFAVRGNRSFTIVTLAMDETGSPSNQKAMPAIGIWDAFDPVDAPAVGAAPGLNGLAAGETWLQVGASAADVVRVGIADSRGDGRPDYAYNGWVLYADTVEPARLPASGGPITIHGMGFRISDTVEVGGQAALVESISPTEIVAIAPAATAGVTGSVNVEVDDAPLFYASAVIEAGISYDSGNGDALTLLSGPSNTEPIGVPIPFVVQALGSTFAPAGGVTVTYSVVSGTATLGCGQSTCAVTATGDGRALMNVTAVDVSLSVVTASLTNGSSIEAQFSGGTPPALAALTSQLSLAAGATFTWTVQALALSQNAPAPGQSVQWSSVAGIAAPSGAVLTNANGIAAQTLTVGPLAEGQLATINACVNGTSSCATFSVVGARPEYSTLIAVSGTNQSLAASATPSQIVLRVFDMDGEPMAGGTVSLYQALYAWSPPCEPHAVCTQGVLL
ncbi:MAG TPA: IPT/TIG domain-containing protein, partial [Terracidiphilus sp.]|nr:IPT/TIG domain-containing protein [Terracidiphilus sp.]